MIYFVLSGKAKGCATTNDLAFANTLQAIGFRKVSKIRYIVYRMIGI